MNEKDTSKKIELFKSIVSSVILVMIVGSLLVGVAIYSARDDNGKLVKATQSGETDYETDGLTAESFIEKMTKELPEFKTERVSYGAYRIIAGEKFGEAIVNVSDTGGVLSVVVKYPYISNYLDFISGDGQESPFVNYFDGKQAETMQAKLYDVADSFSKVFWLYNGYMMTENEKLMFADYVNDCMSNEKAKTLYLNHVDVIMRPNSDDEDISVIIYGTNK